MAGKIRTMRRAACISDTNAKWEDKTAIPDYGKSSMISMIDSCSSSGSGVNSNGDKNNAVRSTVWFNRQDSTDRNKLKFSEEILKQIQLKNNF